MSERPRPSTKVCVAAAATSYVLCILTCACSWSVPADPARNAQERRRDRAEAPEASRVAWAPAAPGAFDPGARALYEDHCGRCHVPWPATHLTASEWPRYVARYGPQAGLFGEARARVLGWLQANARPR